MPAEMIPMIATTISISMSENPCCWRRAGFLVFMLIPLPDHRANSHRPRKQREVIVRTSQFRRNNDRLDIRRRRLDVPPDVIDGLPAVGSAHGVEHVIPGRVAGAARGWGEVDVTRGQ